MSDFKSLNLAEPLQRALDKMGYETPTPIQTQAIPDVLAGRDLMGIAQTGTGKTAAFALPVLSRLLADPKPAPKRGARTLVLAPTRELASQIAESFRDYARFIDGFGVAVVFGGVSLPAQVKKLVHGHDVMVATPGRLIDLLDRKAITLRDIEYLILDEADQMMDMGFIHALRKIVSLLPKERQTLFFSATMAKNIDKLAQQYLTNPVKVSVTPPNSTAEKIDQSVIFVNKSEKQDLLALTLLDEAIDRALVFTRTKHGANKVVKKLAQVGINSRAIHGNKSQAQRQKALAAFKEGEIKVLIATDVAARGIDIEGISHVINFEIPNVPEQYVHRIGRTARANRSGLAIAFVDGEERAYLKDIQKLLKTKIPIANLPDDFVAKARALSKRTPIVLENPSQPAGRKGRGKSRNKNKNRKGGGKGGGSGNNNKNNNLGASSQKKRGPKSGGSNANGERGRVTAKGTSSGAPQGEKAAQGRAKQGGAKHSGAKPAANAPSRNRKRRNNASTRKAPTRSR